jgi:hypothetical protein
MSGISNIFTMYNCQDIIIIILVLAVLYLIYKTSGNNKTDHFTVTDDVKEAINEIYKADINAIRNLSNFATEIKNNNDSLTIPAKTTTVIDLNGANSQFTNITSDNGNIKNITVDGNIIYTNKTNTLGNLGDANITTPTNGNILVYSNSKWINVQSIAGCYNGYLTGPWASHTTLPKDITSTSGAPFEVPIAGNYVINVNASAWATGYAMIVLEIYINGVGTNNSLKMYANEINSHKTLIPISFKYALNKGTNYLFLRHFSGFSDYSDFASFSYIYSP